MKVWVGRKPENGWESLTADRAIRRIRGGSVTHLHLGEATGILAAAEELRTRASAIRPIAVSVGIPEPGIRVAVLAEVAAAELRWRGK